MSDSDLNWARAPLKDLTSAYFDALKKNATIEQLQLKKETPASQLAEICTDMRQYIQLLMPKHEIL